MCVCVCRERERERERDVMLSPGTSFFVAIWMVSAWYVFSFCFSKLCIFLRVYGISVKLCILLLPVRNVSVCREREKKKGGERERL